MGHLEPIMFTNVVFCKHLNWSPCPMITRSLRTVNLSAFVNGPSLAQEDTYGACVKSPLTRMVPLTGDRFLRLRSPVSGPFISRVAGRVRRAIVLLRKIVQILAR